MATNGVDIVEQLRGRAKFYHVGDPVRKDMEAACEEIGDLRIKEFLMQAIIDEAEKHLDGVTGDGLSRVPSLSVVNAASVGAWLDAEGIKLLPWQRKRLGLAPPPREPIETGV
jgi:hypothetical protein